MASAGLVVCACLATAGLVADVQYAVVLLPLTALALATVWSLVFFGAAWIVSEVGRRRPR
ncbi:hypothetical protein [Microbacterium marinilacus]|uniref:Integral membrane protein n=1 Tax=Microbacterium marinilacus TaxID=415209 RepID=A0ABP7B8C6_9MICO|nr:hypothetical protein [Microbacterium marinilacus]MBY0687531.1 hypothetical protein [Microbacterium marinilacus]